jgi:putative chitinase
MVITQAQLLRAVPNLYKPRLDEFVASFNMWAVHFGINSPKRIVHYLSQCFHESGNLRYVEEIASGQQYEGRKDLGNTEVGDGKRYKGRGFIQITGRSNYTSFKNSDCCTEDVVKNPEKVAQYPLNQVASMWFWQKNGLNEMADRDDGGTSGEDVCKNISKRVNGGYNGLSDRLYLYRRFKKEFL